MLDAKAAGQPSAVDMLNELNRQLQACVDALGKPPAPRTAPQKPLPKSRRATPLDMATADLVVHGSREQRLAQIEAAMAELDGKPKRAKPKPKRDDLDVAAARISAMRSR